MSLRYIFVMAVMIALVLSLSVCSDEGGEELTDAQRWEDNIQPTAPSGGEARYTIMSFNADGFDRGWYPGKTNSFSNPDFRTKQHEWVANIIKTNAVDLLGLVEVLEGTDRKGKTAHDLADLWTELTNKSYSMPQGRIYGVTTGDGDNCIAVCGKSTIPISDYDAIRDNDGTRFTRSIYKYKVTFPGNNVVWFYSAHLKALTGADDQAGRKAEAKALANYIRANHDLKNDYIVVYGDMNTVSPGDWPNVLQGAFPLAATNYPSGSPTDCTLGYLEMRTGDDTEEFFTSLSRKYIYPNPTFRQGISANILTNGLPLDHIILSPALYKNHFVPGSAKVVGADRVQVGSDTVSQAMQDTRNPSDHLPVTCQLYF